MEGTGFLFRIEDIHIHPTIHNIMMLCLCTYCIGGGLVSLWLVLLLLTEQKFIYFYRRAAHNNMQQWLLQQYYMYVLILTICDIR